MFILDGFVSGCSLGCLLWILDFCCTSSVSSSFFHWFWFSILQAYKRVGSMIHNGDVGRGIIGVIDLTDLMVQIMR